MTVTVPSRNFHKVAVPESGIGYARRAADFTYRMSLRFMGSRDPLDQDATPLLARIEMARFDITNAPWFYPHSTPLNGGEAVEDSLYRDKPEPSPAVDPRPMRGAY